LDADAEEIGYGEKVLKPKRTSPLEEKREKISTGNRDPTNHSRKGSRKHKCSAQILC